MTSSKAIQTTSTAANRYKLTEDGQLFRRTNQEWHPVRKTPFLDDFAIDMAVGGDGRLYITTNGGSSYSFDGEYWLNIT